MGKPLLIVAAGLLFLLFGCRSLVDRSIEDTYHEHLYRGETITLLCRDGEPVQDDEEIEEWSARAICRDEKDEQARSRTSATRLFFLGGLGAVIYGAVQMRKARS